MKGKAGNAVLPASVIHVQLNPYARLMPEGAQPRQAQLFG